MLTPKGIQTIPPMFQLSWSHCVFLLSIKNEEERSFYAIESIEQGWSLRELKRLYNSGLYERLALSRDKDAVRRLATDGQIIDTIINAIAGVLTNLGAEASAIGMLIVQTICNFFIPSGSGQAFVTMPIMSPLATLTGVPQQTAVLAFQFGDGFTNMVVPTSALVIGALALGKIPYGAWVRFIVPLLVKLFVLAIVFLVATVHLGDAFGFHPQM